MTASGWLVATAYAVAVVVLVRASAAKLASPTVAASAVSEILPRRLALRPRSVRLVAVVELVTAVLAAIPVARRPATGLILALGVVFAGVGVLGLLRGSNKPCGCFGSGSDRRLGWSNVASGALFVIFAAAMLAVPQSYNGTQVAIATSLLSVTGLSGWTLIDVRRQVHDVLGKIVIRHRRMA
jgi:hypothetical protein